MDLESLKLLEAKIGKILVEQGQSLVVDQPIVEFG